MYTVDNSNLHELRKLELKFKLLYFLRDLNIKSSFEPAVDCWTDYVSRLSTLMGADECFKD